MISSGTPEHLFQTDGPWAILDVGFAKEKASCGLLLPGGVAECVTYGEARSRLAQLVATSTGPTNLVIEAPLSVAFSQHGNPTGRSVEARGKRTRYWYVNSACTVMVAALYLIRDLAAAQPLAPVRLFEGFVSFKSAPSGHVADVKVLQEVVLHPATHGHCIVAAGSLKTAPTDILTSAGSLCGIDFGIPTVLIAAA